MIISASRRTDIPAFYSQWLVQRLREEYVLVRNPMNTRQISRVRLHPELVECIVFWTKNPQPLLTSLATIDTMGFMYYFQFTLTAYGKDIEAALPPQVERIKTLQQLADRLGPERVIWRYDPILLTSEWTVNRHLDQFYQLARQLSGYTQRCVISFVVGYAKTRRNTKKLGLLPITSKTMQSIAEQLHQAALSCGITIETCASEIEGVNPGCCIDPKLIGKLLQQPLAARKDSGQRPECRCCESIDIGAYNTCRHQCCYCYANANQASVVRNVQAHDPRSPLLTGQPEAQAQIRERQMKRLAASNTPQQQRFDLE